MLIAIAAWQRKIVFVYEKEAKTLLWDVDRCPLSISLSLSICFPGNAGDSITKPASSSEMGSPSWPSAEELNRVRKITSMMAGRDVSDVQVAVSPYRICPLGAHIDHQGGTVLAMTINKGILLGFVPSDDSQVLLQSGQFDGEVKFSIDEVQHQRSIKINNSDDRMKVQEEANWGNYARGAIYALQTSRKPLRQVPQND